uniref:Uncharacterized protein n=1 Tax=Leersia perrieri TaxID=77586 RepID=A0A0D9WSV2_9ORYZ
MRPIRVTLEGNGSATVRRHGGDVAAEKVGETETEVESSSSAGSCVTPTSAASAMPAATACPPAPRKPRPAKRMTTTTKRCCCGRPRRSPLIFFPVPHDLAAVFVARAPAATAAAACSPPAKKIRVHAVG